LGTGLDEYGDDDSEEDAPVAAAAPVLDPKSQPRSLGISFFVRAREPHIAICATWARYKELRDPRGKQVFQRVPNCYVTPEPISVTASQLLDETDGIKISLRTVRRADDTYKLSLYLVNETSLRDPLEESGKRRVQTSDLIFQPQIRVVMGENTELLPFDSFQLADEKLAPGSLEEEDESLALIYRDYQAYARGHLCAAVWKEIDPEAKVREENKLKWIDAEVVESTGGKQQSQKFIVPDCRTEYVPCYPVQSPEIDWKSDSIERTPELATARLAEIWAPRAMSEALQPLADGYAAWIARQKAEVNALECRYQRAGNRHLASCDRARQRIQEAIDLIAEN